ncbi:hypothetical protein AB4359_20765 [Vibrio splendidus]
MIITRPFGTLVQVFYNYEGYLCIKNTAGKVLRMSSKFPQRAKVESLAHTLVGQEVAIQTSQTTAKWASTVWFCGISRGN